MDARAIAVANGLQVSGNNIFNLPGVELFPSGPGQLEPMFDQSMHAIGGDFVILSRTFVPHTGPASFGGHFDHAEVARFTSWDDLQTWLAVNGQPSIGGINNGVD